MVTVSPGSSTKYTVTGVNGACSSKDSVQVSVSCPNTKNEIDLISNLPPGNSFRVYPNPASAQGKVAQTSVAYQEKPKGAQRCDGCSLFQPPNTCKVVDGQVSPQGWCSLFTAKA